MSGRESPLPRNRKEITMKTYEIALSEEEFGHIQEGLAFLAEYLEEKGEKIGYSNAFKEVKSLKGKIAIKTGVC